MDQGRSSSYAVRSQEVLDSRADGLFGWVSAGRGRKGGGKGDAEVRGSGKTESEFTEVGRTGRDVLGWGTAGSLALDTVSLRSPSPL